MNLKGIFPPIPTPFANDAIDHRALAANIDRWMKTRLSGLVILGSNAEAPLLEDDEADVGTAHAFDRAARLRTAARRWRTHM